MSKLYDLLYSVIGKVNKSIKTEAQALTDEQKIQARANISALPLSHDADPQAHNDIRSLISNLADRLNLLANSDDETLDQMSEVVAYIKANKTLIEQITTGKVSVTDIVDNLTTANTKKPLSANQGVVLKKLIGDLTTALANKPDLTEEEITSLTAAIL